jgi:hypothetical protein
MVALPTMLLLGGPVQADPLFGSGTQFLDGFLTLLQTPLAVTGCISLAAASALSLNDRVLKILAIAMLSACGCFYWSPGWRTMAAPIGCVVSGIIAAAGTQVPAPMAYTLAVLAGAGVGLSLEPRHASGLLLLGVGLGLIVATLWIIQIIEWVPANALVRRIVGAWMAATGLLLGALELRGALAIHG